MSEKVQLKYMWRKTWEDVPDDFEGIDPSREDFFGKPLKFGRIFLGHVPEGTGWLWCLQWSPHGYGDILPSGVAATAREAAKAMEDAYDEICSSVANIE